MLPKNIESQDSRVFSLYAPFRNYIRKLDLFGSLRGVRAHANHFLFERDLPSYITNVPSGYYRAKNFSEFINYHLFPWELHILAKEVIINSQLIGERKSLEEWNILVGAVNRLKAFEEGISKIYITQDNVLTELHRVSHRQFTWQKRITMEEIARYWKLYSHPKLENMFEKVTGLSMRNFYLVGFVFIGFYLDKFALFYPPRVEVRDLTKDHIDKFLSKFCKPLPELQRMLAEDQEINEKYAYAYNALFAYPLIKTQYEDRDAIICPIPALLSRRITQGLYYEVCREANFDRIFGEAFQDFIGDMLRMSGGKLNVLEEKAYGRPEKRTVDWIVYDESAILFIECKAKRLTLEAKVELLGNKKLSEQLEILADYVVQTYKGIEDYKENKYPQIKYDEGKKTYPIIVTSEEWYFFGDRLVKLLDEKLEKKLVEANIDTSVLKSSPYIICSVDSLDLLMQVAKSVGIEDIMAGKNSNQEVIMWQIDNYIKDKYKKEVSEVKNLFMDEFEKYLGFRPIQEN